VTSDQVPWLSAEQQRVWRSYLLGAARLSERLDADLRPFGIDLSEYEILVTLSEADDRRLRMSDLAALVHQSRSRLTHAVARLEKDDLVVREPVPHDKRGVVAVLTDAGMDLLRRAAPDHVRSVRRYLVDAVPPADYEAMGRVFAAVTAVTD